jgi:Family of unknown function (DUF6690)
MRKSLLLALLPIVTAIGPVALFTAGEWYSTNKDRLLPTASLSAAPTPGMPASPAAVLPGSPIPGMPAPGMTVAAQAQPYAAFMPAQVPGSVATQELAEVLRFDVTPGWVMGRWPLVSAGLSQLHFQGYRVPLVSGSREDDVAGALTYYFDARQQVQRITFQGTTGDAGKLIQFLGAKYHFGRRLMNDPSLFRFEVPAPSGPAKSVLEVRLVRPNQAFHRFDVTLVIERPAE